MNVQRVVDNRVLLLGLDWLYREAVKTHERGELLKCARVVSNVLGAGPADVPVEGYYAEDDGLTEYFRLIRTLQDIDESALSSVDSLSEFRRLRDVTSSRLYGRPQQRGKLLPVGRDALSQALLDVDPGWTVASLTSAAGDAAQASDDISLVGLAARVRDSVVLAAARESVVLYAEVMALGPPPRPRYVWEVDEDLAAHVKRFIDVFETLFGEKLPQPTSAHAERYWIAYERNVVLGRCVRLAYDDRDVPKPHYHWAICRGADGALTVQGFWAANSWTTARYRSALRDREGCPEL